MYNIFYTVFFRMSFME